MNVKRMLAALLKGGQIGLITGDRDSGKTHLAMLLADWFLKHGGWVLSNVPLGLKHGDTPYVNPEEGYPEHYLKTTTLAQLWLYLSEIFHRNPADKVIVIIDEAGVSLEALEFHSQLVRQLISVGALLRKFNCTLVLLTQRRELVARRLVGRKEEGKRERPSIGMSDWWVSKEPLDLSKYARDFFRQGYDIKQLGVVYWPARGIFVPSPFIIPESPKLARRFDNVELGGFYFDTMGSATFGLGKHPKTGADFSFKDLNKVIGSALSAFYPSLLYQFMHTDPTPLVAAAEAVQSTTTSLGETDEETVTLEQEPEEGPLNLTGESVYKKRAVVDEIKLSSGASNAEIARRTNSSREYVRLVRKEIKERGLDAVTADLEGRRT